MRAAVYLRVSSDRQDEANQEPDCLRICAARSWEPIVIREQESTRKCRPAWEQVRQLVHRAEVGAVVIWALDRAGRDRVRLAHDLREMARKGAQLVSVRESWLDQPPGPTRDLLIEIFGWFAESERDRISLRTRAALARARDKGVRLGRPPIDAAAMARAAELVRGGAAVAAAARLSGIGRRTLREHLAQMGICRPDGKPPESCGQKGAA